MKIDRLPLLRIAIIFGVLYAAIARAETPLQILDRMEGDIARLREAIAPVPDPEPLPDPPPAPDPVPVPVDTAPAAGVFALQPPLNASGQGRIITDAMLRLPQVAGVIFRFRTYNVLKPNGQFDWTWLDAQVARARKAGKPFGLLLMGGDFDKPWLNPFAAEFAKVTAACGLRYPDAVSWHVGGAASPKKSSEELHHQNPMPQEALDAVKQQIDLAATSFPRAAIVLAISARDKSGRMQQAIAHLAAKAPGRGLVCHNALKLKDLPPQTPEEWLTAPQNDVLVNAIKTHAPNLDLGFEMVSPTASEHPQNSKFPRAGSRDINDSLWQAARVGAKCGVPREKIHVRVYPDDLAKVKL